MILNQVDILLQLKFVMLLLEVAKIVEYTL